MKQTEANRRGIEYVAKRMDWYWSLPADLPGESTGRTNQNLATRREWERQIVYLYKHLLLY